MALLLSVAAVVSAMVVSAVIISSHNPPILIGFRVVFIVLVLNSVVILIVPVNKLIPTMQDRKIIHEMQIAGPRLDLQLDSSRDALEDVERFALRGCEGREVGGAWVRGVAEEGRAGEVYEEV